MNNITFTAQLKSYLPGVVLKDTVEKFSEQTKDMPSGIMYLYKGQHAAAGDLCYIASLRPNAPRTEKLEIDSDSFEKYSGSEKASILSLAYKLLLQNEAYQEKCAMLAMKQAGQNANYFA